MVKKFKTSIVIKRHFSEIFVIFSLSFDIFYEKRRKVDELKKINSHSHSFGKNQFTFTFIGEKKRMGFTFMNVNVNVNGECHSHSLPMSGYQMIL